MEEEAIHLSNNSETNSKGGIVDQLHSPELIQALQELAQMQISPEEKLKRIDRFLSTLKRIYWRDFFEVLQSIPQLYSLSLLKIEDLIGLYASLKNYKGAHSMKNRVFLTVNELSFLFRPIQWHTYPLRTFENEFGRKRVSIINPYGQDVKKAYTKCLKKGIIKKKGKYTIEKGGENADLLYRLGNKLEAFPNLKEYLWKYASDLSSESDAIVNRKVKEIQREWEAPQTRLIDIQPLIYKEKDERVNSFLSASFDAPDSIIEWFRKMAKVLDIETVWLKEIYESRPTLDKIVHQIDECNSFIQIITTDVSRGSKEAGWLGNEAGFAYTSKPGDRIAVFVEKGVRASGLVHQIADSLSFDRNNLKQSAPEVVSYLIHFKQKILEKE